MDMDMDMSGMSSMSTTAAAAGATPLSMTMDPSATSSSSSMSNMNMDTSSHSMSTRMSASMMDMTFYTSTSTSLFSQAWTPTGTGAYAGTCIFLIFLSFLLRFLYVCKFALEQRWRDRALNRRYVVTQRDADADDDAQEEGPNRTTTTTTTTTAEKSGATTGVLSTNGLQQHVRILEDHSNTHVSRARRRRLLGASGVVSGVQPFRASVDVPRAVLVTVIVGVAYLLMLAVMTMNVGFFLSVLAGAFLGELVLGRYVAGRGTVVGGH